MSRVITIDDSFERKLIVKRACQLAISKNIKRPSDECFTEARRWADYVITNFRPSREQSAKIILELLAPKQ